MTDTENNPELTPEEKLQLDNELLKIKLQAEFGMGKMDSSLDRGAENEWLNYIYNFEKQYAEQKRCKIYDFIGRPALKKVEELTKAEITIELTKITELLQANGIELSAICDYEDEIIYRFITEEFFQEEIDEVRIDGMMHCFTYEDYYPNHEYDIRRNADEFIEFLIAKNWDDYLSKILLASTVEYNNDEHNQNSFPPIILAFQNANGNMKLLQWNILKVDFDLETENAVLVGEINYKSSSPKKAFQGNVYLKFKLEYGFWSISKVELPGFSA